MSALDRYQYLLLMAGCLMITLPLEWVMGARVYRRVRALIFALLPVVIIFSIWDIAGILREHWSYNPRYVSGLQLGLGMPVEELVFFIVVPICGLLTYGAVGRVLPLVTGRASGRPRPHPDRPDAERPASERPASERPDRPDPDQPARDQDARA